MEAIHIVFGYIMEVPIVIIFGKELFIYREYIANSQWDELINKDWENDAGDIGEHVETTTPWIVARILAPGRQGDDITCPVCRQKWQAGMKRVRRLFRNYRGEE